MRNFITTTQVSNENALSGILQIFNPAKTLNPNKIAKSDFIKIFDLTFQKNIPVDNTKSKMDPASIQPAELKNVPIGNFVQSEKTNIFEQGNNENMITGRNFHYTFHTLSKIDSNPKLILEKNDKSFKIEEKNSTILNSLETDNNRKNNKIYTIPVQLNGISPDQNITNNTHHHQLALKPLSFGILNDNSLKGISASIENNIDTWQNSPNTFFSSKPVVNTENTILNKNSTGLKANHSTTPVESIADNHSSQPLKDKSIGTAIVHNTKTDTNFIQKNNPKQYAFTQVTRTNSGDSVLRHNPVLNSNPVQTGPIKINKESDSILLKSKSVNNTIQTQEPAIHKKIERTNLHKTYSKFVFDPLIGINLDNVKQDPKSELNIKPDQNGFIKANSKSVSNSFREISPKFEQTVLSKSKNELDSVILNKNVKSNEKYIPKPETPQRIEQTELPKTTREGNSNLSSRDDFNIGRPFMIENQQFTLFPETGRENNLNNNILIQNGNKANNNTTTVLNNSSMLSHHANMNSDKSTFINSNKVINETERIRPITTVDKNFITDPEGRIKPNQYTDIKLDLVSEKNGLNKTDYLFKNIKSDMPGTVRLIENQDKILYKHQNTIYIEKNTFKSPVVSKNGNDGSKDKNGNLTNSSKINNNINFEAAMDPKKVTLKTQSNTVNDFKDNFHPENSGDLNVKSSFLKHNDTIIKNSGIINSNEIPVKSKSPLINRSGFNIKPDEKPLESVLNTKQTDDNKVSTTHHKISVSTPKTDNSILTDKNIVGKPIQNNGFSNHNEPRAEKEITQDGSEKGKLFELNSVNKISDNKVLSSTKINTVPFKADEAYQNNSNQNSNYSDSAIKEKTVTPVINNTDKKITSGLNETGADRQKQNPISSKIEPENMKKVYSNGRHTPVTTSGKTSQIAKTIVPESNNAFRSEKFLDASPKISFKSDNIQKNILKNSNNKINVSNKKPGEGLPENNLQARSSATENLTESKLNLQETSETKKADNTKTKVWNQQPLTQLTNTKRTLINEPPLSNIHAGENELKSGYLKEFKSTSMVSTKEPRNHKLILSDEQIKPVKETLKPIGSSDKIGRDKNVATKILPENPIQSENGKVTVKINKPESGNTLFENKNDLEDILPKNETKTKFVQDLTKVQNSLKNNNTNVISLNKQSANTPVAHNAEIKTVHEKVSADKILTNQPVKSENPIFSEKSLFNQDKHNSDSNNFQHSANDKHTILYSSDSNQQVFENSMESALIGNQMKNQPAVTKSIELSNLTGKINESITQFTNQNNGEQLIINTKVSDLGNLRIELLKKDGNIEVILRVQSENSQKILEQSLPELRLNLAKSEVPIDDVRIMFTDPRERQQTAKNREFERDRKENRKEKKVAGLKIDSDPVKSGSNYISQWSNYETIA